MSSTELPEWLKDLSADSKRQMAWLVTEAGSDISIDKLDQHEEILAPILSGVLGAKVPEYTTVSRDATDKDTGMVLKLFKESTFIDHIFTHQVETAQRILYTSYRSRDTQPEVHIEVITSPEWPEVQSSIIESAFVVALTLPKLFPWAEVPKTTKILLIPTPVLKEFSYSGTWTSYHINTGYSDNRTVIWRRQEMLKVIIHELMHLYSIELSKQFYDNNKKWSKIETETTPVNNLNHDPRWNEGVTEALAVLVHSAMMCRIYNLGMKHYKLILEFERVHVRAMAAAIYSIKPVDETKETTAVFSYFVVRSLLLDHIETFMELLAKRSYSEFIARVTEWIDKWKPGKVRQTPPFLRMTCITL